MEMRLRGDHFREHVRDVEMNDKDASKPVARHLYLPAFLSIWVRLKAAKTWNRNLPSKLASLVLEKSTNAFHSSTLVY